MDRRLLGLWSALLCCVSGCQRTKAPASEPAVVSATATANASASAAPSALPAASAPRAASAQHAKESASADAAPPIHVETRLVRDLKPGERRPLVVFLHGLGASAKLTFEVTPLAALGARDRVHVIAGDGTLDSAGRRFWNAGKACCNFDDRPIDDVARLAALIDEWAARPEVDPKRIYLAGYSNGGFMAHRFACERGEKLAAAVVLAGGVEFTGPCSKQREFAIMLVHGDADTIVPYAGGHVFQKPELASFLSTRDGLREWGKRLGCEDEIQGPSLDLDPELPGNETASFGYKHCEFGRTQLLSVHGGTHYLGSRPKVVEAAWKFLLSQPRFHH